MICSKCGAELVDGAQFCAACGQSVSSRDASEAVRSALAKESADRYGTASGAGALQAVPASPQRSTGWTSRLPIIAAAVALVGIAVGAAFAWGMGQHADDPASSNGSAGVASSSLEVATSAEASYYLGVYDGNVAVLIENGKEPAHISRLSVSDLDPSLAADLGAGVPVASLKDGLALIDAYQSKVDSAAAEEKAKADAEAKAAQEAQAAAKAEAEAAAAKEAQERVAKEAEQAAKEKAEKEAQEAKARQEDKAAADAAKAARMVESMEGWWQMNGTDPYVYIGGGDWIIYRADGSNPNHFRTLSAGDLVRFDNGLPGEFNGGPGYYIYTTDPQSLGYYLSDEDFDADGRIDVIRHASPDGSDHKEDQNIYRVSPPPWA
ncbi:MAG: zinc ribbon domain-containing protein [Eggerthellaceae bacterium]|nr:zinc ribbon domain-containing protein [Eggerthellaceae bacterium]